MIDIIKFLHILFVLSLFGSVIYCLAISNKGAIVNAHKTILYFVLFAMLTGTLLIYPKHYTFQTPWIRAAYILLAVFSVGILWLFKRQKKPASFKERFFYQISYLFLISILVFIIHDAVTKTTFF